MAGLRFADSHGAGYASGEHEVVLEMKPQALLFKGAIREPVRPLVCGSCGLVAFFAATPERLWDAHRARAAGERG